MKQLLSTALLLCITLGAFAQEYVPYIPEDQLPDVVQCIPAPPSRKSAEFKYDVVRYKWGKQQRKDPARLEMAIRNAMLRHCFKPLDSEWWHFTLKNEPYPDTYFTFPVY